MSPGCGGATCSLRFTGLGRGLPAFAVRHLPAPVRQGDPCPDPLGGSADLLPVGLGEGSVGIRQDVPAPPLGSSFSCQSAVSQSVGIFPSGLLRSTCLQKERRLAFLVFGERRGEPSSFGRVVTPSLAFINISFPERDFQGNRAGGEALAGIRTGRPQAIGLRVSLLPPDVVANMPWSPGNRFPGNRASTNLPTVGRSGSRLSGHLTHRTVMGVPLVLSDLSRPGSPPGLAGRT